MKTSCAFSVLLAASAYVIEALTAPPPIAGPPAASFAADPLINVAGIYAAAHSSKTKVLASYPINSARKIISSIYGDWQNLSGVSAFHFIADMDTDCDGTKVRRKTGNRDGQTETSFGALDATRVPYFVLPERFTVQYKSILKGNALGAIICDGKMLYGIYGDQDADSPQLIGEASIVMGQTCFPGTLIDGANGHAENDVAYIVFGSQVPPGISKNNIDLHALKDLGDAQMKLLQNALGL
ncbi:fungal chitosanase of glycosyl hydrolase group 75-domain-containing protein [Mycena belliarum]|uniref:Endo-chitosanase n=1 Tax=Mycena belliarum TaxID=1033014 RepID=A0AAD6TUV8_9AGAR|nr:fungal chitosanase of glycosyl hydrolase group 75-domain-containing protein [Mycena belliae]